MPRAIWKGAVIAEAADAAVEIVEGNVYFPVESVRADHLAPSETQTVCPWKGTASYHNVVVEGEVNRDAAWFYAEPKPAAENIRGRIAFWRGISIEN